MSSKPKDTESDKLKINEQKWSKPLMDAGWTAIPSVIIERQRALGLDATDINILMHLAAYWWTADNRPHPSKGTIAAAMDITPRSVQRRIARLEACGFVRRQERRLAGKGSKPNVYHLDGLIAAAAPYAQEKIEEITKRRAENADRVKRKRRPILQLVSSNEDDED